MSLGGYTVALLAGIEAGLDGVVAGIPVSDFPGALPRAQPPAHPGPVDRAPDHGRHRPRTVYRVVSPLRVRPPGAPDRRYIFAGYGDRLATPDQARRLAEHWGEPEVSWYAGNHVGYLWSGQVTDFLEASLAEAAGITPAPDDAAA